MAVWYKDGKKIDEENRIYKRVEITPGGKAIFISIAQKSDEVRQLRKNFLTGFYERLCEV